MIRKTHIFRLLAGGLILSAAWALAALDPSRMEEIDGRQLPEARQWPRADVVKRFRPWVVEDDRGTLVVSDLRLHSITNMKAIDIALVSPDRVPGRVLCYDKVIVRNCDISRISRDEVGGKHGLHIDFLRIAGGGDHQPIETDVLIEDVHIHDGNALPILVQDGKYRSVTLRRVRIENTTLGAQFATINSGYINQIVIEQCPGLRVALMGRPGTIKRCIVRDSPGAQVSDVPNVNGRSGAEISIDRLPPATRPATMAAASQRAEPLRLLVQPQSGGARALLAGTLPDNAVCVIFEAFDMDDYRVAMPVTVTDGPWQADLRINKTGRFRVAATVKRVGGAADAPVIAFLEIRSAP